MDVVKQKNTLSIRNYLIKRTCTKTNQPEDIVQRIANYQFTEVLQAIYNYNTIEVSGMFTLYVSKKKALRRKLKLTNFKNKLERDIQSCTDDNKKLVSLQRVHESITNELDQLESKLLKFEEL